MTSYDLRRKNARVRDKIHQVLEKHPELRDVTEEIALRQDLHVRSDSDLGYRNTRWSSTHARLNPTLDPSLPM
jgi:hypothetical protein